MITLLFIYTAIEVDDIYLNRLLLKTMNDYTT
jgi:hypothetical protein